MAKAVEVRRSPVSPDVTPVWRSLPCAGPALVAFAAIRILGLLVLEAFSRATGKDAHFRLTWWDGQWYEGIARNGYGLVWVHPDGRLLSDYAFFPLYPLSERGVAAVTGLRFVDAGLLVSAASALLAAWGIFAIGNHLYGRRVAILLTVLWAALPVGVVESMAYSESLFTAAAAWALYAAVTGRWVLAGALASLAGLTRPTGVAVAAAVILPATLAVLPRSPETHGSVLPARADRSSKRGPLVGAALAPLGWLGYVGWVGWRTGSVTGYFEVTDRWGNGFDAGFAFAGWTWGLIRSPDFILGVLVCLGVAVVIGLLAWCVRQGQPLPLLVFSSVVVVMAFTTTGYFGSKPRYLLPAFPLLLPLAGWLARQRPVVAVSIVALAATASAAYGAIWLLGPGPP